ncbi:hypothetical protein GQ54DRAFT_311418 [Martensiomyces pterosporus]|nr:hypothetical protein GQ54DRAFT_311418 [Martensiomyces pterosporus]
MAVAIAAFRGAISLLSRASTGALAIRALRLLKGGQRAKALINAPSNPLIIASGYKEYTRELLVQSVGCGIDYTGLAETLKNTGFGSVYWTRMHVLGFLDDHSTSQPSPNGFPDRSSEAAGISEYLIQKLPNINALLYEIWDISKFPLNRLVNAYLRQLKRLHVRMYWPPMFEHAMFSQNLTHLTVCMNFEEPFRLPRVLASSLRYLQLAYTPFSVAWTSFYSDTGGEVWFTNLEHLFIEFQIFYKPPRSSSIRALATGGSAEIDVRHDTEGKRIHFPKLHTLEIIKYPYRDSSFYSMFRRAPLRSVVLHGPVDSFQYFDAQMASNLTHINLYSMHMASNASGTSTIVPTGGELFEQFLVQLLGTPSSLRVGLLISKAAKPIALPRTLKWTHIQQLELCLHVNMSSVLAVLGQLQMLRYLWIKDIFIDLDRSGDDESDCWTLPVNRHVLSLVLFREASDFSTQKLLHCLSFILPCIPSLMKLGGATCQPPGA